MKRFFLILFFLSVFFVISPPNAKAMDPATLAILAPYAIPVAQTAGQYAIRGLANTAEGMVDMFGETCNIFLLPLGVIESTLGLPFGYGYDGLSDIVKGGVAPFKMVYSAMMLPVKMVSVF